MRTAEKHDSRVRYGWQKVDALEIFYREAGNPNKPAILLLHGFPTSSHMYREVLSDLSDEFYLIAPDYPGFGNSTFPSSKEFHYTFDNLAAIIEKFLEKLELTSFVLMMQDYGAPIGFRIATKHPEWIKGLVIQNGNAYEEGLGKEGWGLIFDYWKNKSHEIEQQIISHVFSLEGLKWQYTHGTRQPKSILPDSWDLDYIKINREGNHRIQLDLFYDYQNNLKRYPEWQKYLRENQPPTLITWGKNDAFFPSSGAEAYKRDLKNIDYNLLDTGHFALEEEAPFIVKKMRHFVRSL